MALYMLVLSALVFDTGLSHILEYGDEVDTLVWPPEYHFKGEKTDFATGIIEPFEIWYSAEHNKSRIDHFGGTVKKYYIGGTEDDPGAMFQVFPISTDEEKNHMMCNRASYEEATKNFLPSSNFSYVGDTEFDGREVEIWKSTDIDEYDCRIDEILYVYRNGDVHVPLRYEKAIHYVLNGALFNHYVTLFQEYGSPKVEELDVENDKACNDVGIWGNNLRTDIKMLHPDISSEVEEAFERYKKHHSKDYKYGEHALRKMIFRDNWKRIQEHNSKNLSYKMDINEFSDKTAEELGYLTATRFTGGMGTEKFQYSEEELEDMVKDLPENFDLRIEGYISKVKNQGQCGSCWAFATTAAVEGALTRNNGDRRLDLSEQSLVDCAWSYDAAGCAGGFLEGAFKYVMKNGIPTESDYGLYYAENGYCQTENITDMYKLRGFGHVPVRSVNAMKVALYQYGPVAIGMHASDSMMLYSSGIYFDPDCNKYPPNHAMVVVGYGVRDGDLYWTIKNSYGEQWGEDGYILISARDNNCHVLEYAVYPVV